jgi:hypothetical protein
MPSQLHGTLHVEHLSVIVNCPSGMELAYTSLTPEASSLRGYGRLPVAAFDQLRSIDAQDSPIDTDNMYYEERHTKEVPRKEHCDQLAAMPISHLVS